MPETLRYTGKNPPPELWLKYPNWRNAYEEEGVEGQDETTLMPHEVQNYIAAHTSFTAGTVRFHDGRKFPVFLAIGKNGVDRCEVYSKGIPSCIYYDYPQKNGFHFEQNGYLNLSVHLRFRLMITLYSRLISI